MTASISYGQKVGTGGKIYILKGWCVWDASRPELGSKGPFPGRAEAEQWALANGFESIDPESAGKHFEIPAGDWQIGPT